MKRLASQLSLMLAALAAAPAALAGTEILKCVDRAGNVTLTDQPCEGAARMTRMTLGPTSESASYGGSGSTSATASGSGAEPQAAPLQRYAATPAMHRQQDWRPRMPARDRPLARDVATLKAARAQMMLLDADRQQPQLATIQ